MKKGELGGKSETRSWSDATRAKKGGTGGEENTNTKTQLYRSYKKHKNTNKRSSWSGRRCNKSEKKEVKANRK